MLQAASVRRPRIGLALAGGGPLGAMYEIGALAALDEALLGIDFNAMKVYVGVSAGGIIAAVLANGLRPDQLARMIVDGRSAQVEPFDPALLLRPALHEYAQRLRRLPPLLAAALWDRLVRGRSWLASLERLGQALPTGVFDGAGLERYLARVFAQNGRSNDFRRLPHALFLVATELDTGAAIAFGAPGYDHVPISQAVQATAALPGLFPPIEIDGRHFVDGGLRKTLHASVALEQGLDLLLCVNPIVPYDARAHRDALEEKLPHPDRLDHLVQGGLPVVLSQSFRSLIHSRLGSGMDRYKKEFPRTDVVMFEPSRADADIFFTNILSYSNRRQLCEHAYQKTRQDLWRRRHQLGPLLARHGVEIDIDCLRDHDRTLMRARVKRRESRAQLSLRELHHTLDDLGRWLQARARA